MSRCIKKKTPLSRGNSLGKGLSFSRFDWISAYWYSAEHIELIWNVRRHRCIDWNCDRAVYWLHECASLSQLSVEAPVAVSIITTSQPLNCSPKRENPRSYKNTTPKCQSAVITWCWIDGHDGRRRRHCGGNQFKCELLRARNWDIRNVGLMSCVIHATSVTG